jgi:pimeloyl-ACP methyl ester carboxylesterase
MTLHISESGTPGAPSIVFLHGLGTTSWMWEGQVEHLRDFHCLNVDLPGQGKSNHLEWKSLTNTADGVAEAIRSRATNGRAHVVALSLGAYVALHLMARHPDAVDHAVLSGVTAAPLPRPRLILGLIRLMAPILKKQFYLRLSARMLHLPDEVFDAYAEGVRSMSRQAFLAVYDEVVYFQPPEALTHVAVPTLIVAGGKEVQAVRDAVPTLTTILPNAQGRIVPGVHHGWNGEAPELFNTVVRAWISGLPLPEQLTPSKALLAPA